MTAALWFVLGYTIGALSVVFASRLCQGLSDDQ